MRESYSVKISKDELVFSAGHFITYDGDVCERLHGHNYQVSAEVFGTLDENYYVVDFIALRDALRAIVGELDHHMLLPTEHHSIRVEANDTEVHVSYDADGQPRRWVFPRCDCVLLPVPNTTSELLARHIGLRLMEDLAQKKGCRPERVRIEVDECFGQSAICDLDGTKG